MGLSLGGLWEKSGLVEEDRIFDAGTDRIEIGWSLLCDTFLGEEFGYVTRTVKLGLKAGGGESTDLLGKDFSAAFEGKGCSKSTAHRFISAGNSGLRERFGLSGGRDLPRFSGTGAVCGETA